MYISFALTFTPYFQANSHLLIIMKIKNKIIFMFAIMLARENMGKKMWENKERNQERERVWVKKEKKEEIKAL